VIGGERNPHVREADLMTEEVEEFGEFAIEPQRHCGHLRGIGTDLMPKNVVCRKTDGKQVGLFFRCPDFRKQLTA